MKKISLSKTTFLEGLRCPRLFWLRINKPSLAEPLDQQTEYLFETGHNIEKYAQNLFPGGIMIGNGIKKPFSQLLAETRTAIESKNASIYEASFASEDMHCRADILHRNGSTTQGWCLGECKMSTKLKPEHIDDLAFQRCCIERAGLYINRAYLVHINNEYTRNGEIEPDKLFAAEEITAETAEESKNIPGKVQRLLNLAKAPVPPQAFIGSRCTSPGRCPFYGHCHEDIPLASVHEIPYGNRLIPLLLDRKIYLLKDIPDDVPLSPRQAAQVQSARSGETVINRTVIKEFLKPFRFPLFFLDFETINSCIPPYDGTSPYQRLPFQFSLHIQRKIGGELEHFEFLPVTSTDPRREICEQLICLLEEKGSIVAWNMPFEKSVLADLGKQFPEHAEKLSRLLPRFVDLIIPFRIGAYADWRCQGSASIKKVLPVLVPSLSYKSMTIQQGDHASLFFQKLVDGTISNMEWTAVRQDLLDYCKLDTLAMVEILKVLQSL